MISFFIILFVTLYSINFIVELYLERLNIHHIEKHRHAPPDLFREVIDQKKYSKSIDYTIDKTKYSRIISSVDFILFLLIIYSGALNWFDIQVRSYGYSELHTGVLFFLLLVLFGTIKSVPVSWYSTFIIEERYGFNTQTTRLWITDLLKNLCLTLIITMFVGYGLLSFIIYSGSYWWLWAWSFIFGIGLLLMKIFPIWIAPLFNTFKEVEEGELYQGIQELSKRAQFTIKNIFTIDAGKRSKHSNAYFTGFGKSKRVVLYDTLIEGMTVGEIIAVLAHEIGHYKLKHIWKGIIMTQLFSLLFFYAASIFLSHTALYQIFMIESKSVYIGVILLSILWSVLSFWVTPFFTWFSRKNEFQADEYALQLCKDPATLKSLFIKLSVENLSNLTPHPLYSKFYYSHPPVIERVARIEAMKSVQ